MHRRKWIARLFVTAVLAASAGPAHAGIIPAAVTMTPDAENFRWTYSVVLPTDMKLQSGNYFTIYDVSGLVPGTIQAPPNWTASVSDTITPPAGLHPHDNAAIPDVTFTYNGPTVATGQLGLGNFWFDSTSGTSTTVDFTAQNPQVSTGNTDRNIVSTLGPAPVGSVSGVPEPTTMALAGLGLPLIGASRLLRRKK
jgi:hypothetical protein